MSDILDPRSVFIYDVSETLTASETKKLIHLMQRNVNGWTLLSEYEVVELNSSGPMVLIKMMQFLERKLEFFEAMSLLLAALEKIGRSDLVHMGLAKGIGSCNPAPSTVRRHGVLTLRADLDRTPTHGVVYYPTADSPPEFDPDITAVKQVYSPTDDQTTGAVADQTAGAVADQTAEAVADQTAGAVADQTAGAVADQTAGAVADQTVGAVADQTVGAVADQTAGAVVDLTAGAVVDLTAGAVADPISISETSDPTENHPLESDGTVVKVFYSPTEAESSEPMEDLIPVDDTDDSMEGLYSWIRIWNEVHNRT